MPRIDKSVFISYRRTNVPWALNIYQYLSTHGYDVFLDYEGIGSGDFEAIIMNNINSRAHFLILLTPSALERCNEPGDWLRLEIETALENRRNIVPIMLEGFSFASPSIASALTGKLALLKSYNGLSLPTEYFIAAMEKLQRQFLTVPLAAVLHPPTRAAQTSAARQKAFADAAPPVHEDELTAQQYFEQALESPDLDEAILLNTEAIRLDPSFAQAYNNRGYAHYSQGHLSAAIQDYNESIKMEPNFAAYDNRGVARQSEGDLDGAIQDFSQSITLKPDHANAYLNRGVTFRAKGDLNAALRDYDQAIKLRPTYTAAYYNRGKLLKARGQPSRAIADLQKYLDLGGGERYGDTGVVNAFIRSLQKNRRV